MKMRYDEITENMNTEIDSIFDALDANKDGSLEKDELKELVSAYDGRPFDEDAFFRFYDTNGNPDGKLDRREFRWYIADWAQALSESDDPMDVAAAKKALPAVVSDLQQLMNVYINK